MPRQLRIAPLLLLAITAGCASGTNNTDRPVGISKSINGLRKSICNCGGVETKEEQKARAGAILPSPTGTNSTNTPPVVQTEPEIGE